MFKFLSHIVVFFIVAALVIDPAFSAALSLPTFAPNTPFLSTNRPHYFAEEALTLAVVSFHQALHSKAKIMVDREATVVIPIPFRSHTDDQSEVTVMGRTLKQALSHLIQQYPDLEKHLLENNTLPSWLDVFVNSTNRSSLSSMRRLWDILPIPPNAFIYLLPSISGGDSLSNEGWNFKAWAEKHRGQQIEGSIGTLAKQFSYSKVGVRRFLKTYGITTKWIPKTASLRNEVEPYRGQYISGTLAAWAKRHNLSRSGAQHVLASLDITTNGKPLLPLISEGVKPPSKEARLTRAWTEIPTAPIGKILNLNQIIRKTINSMAGEAKRNNVWLHVNLPTTEFWIENDPDKKPLGVPPLDLAFEVLFFRALTASISNELWISLEPYWWKADFVMWSNGVGLSARSPENWMNKQTVTPSHTMSLATAKHILRYYGASMTTETTGAGEGFRFIVKIPSWKIPISPTLHVLNSLMLPLAVGMHLFASHHPPSFSHVFALLHPLILAKGLALAATLPSSRYEKQKLTALRAAAKKIHAQDYTITDIAQEADVRIQRIWELLHGDGTLSETAAKIKEGLNRLKRSIGRKELYALRVALERKVYSGHSVRSIARQTGISPRKIQSILDGTTGVSREIHDKLMGAA